MFGFGISPTRCSVIFGSRTANSAPQPPYLAWQYQPGSVPSALSRGGNLLLLSCSAPHFGHVRFALRKAYFASRVEHIASPLPHTCPVGICTDSQMDFTVRCPPSSHSSCVLNRGVSRKVRFSSCAHGWNRVGLSVPGTPP